MGHLGHKVIFKRPVGCPKDIVRYPLGMLTGPFYAFQQCPPKPILNVSNLENDMELTFEHTLSV